MGWGPRIIWGDLDLTAAPFMVRFGFDLGSGSTVYEVVDSLLRDGTIQSTTSTANRTLSLTVLAEAATSTELARLETLLAEQADKPANTLTIRPGDGYGPATVFETFTAQVDHDWNQAVERAGLRAFTCTIPALPAARSLAPRTFTWTGPAAQVHDLTNTSGWTITGGDMVPQLVDFSDFGLVADSAGYRTLKRTINVVGDYLRMVTHGDPTEPRVLDQVKVAGVAVPNARVGMVRASGRHAYTVDVSAYRGDTVEVEFRISPSGVGNASLLSLWAMDYPAATAEVRPRTLGIVDVLGTARSGCHIAFTAPAGGALVYTGPDPNWALRRRGVGETVFAKFTIAAAEGGGMQVGSRTKWFPQGTHATTIGFSDPQPLALNPNGVWPTQQIGNSQWAWPSDRLAAASFFDTSGAKNLISPSPELPTGYHGGAQAHEAHVLHPGRCGFGVYDINGDPITATVTYYPRWKHHAAL